MSIYASIPGIDEDEPCGPPWAYRGSHILPAEDDRRGGVVGLALIPSHITRDGRDDQPDDGTPWPWLRLHLADCGDDPAVLLNPDQARHLAQHLTDWADSTQPSAAADPAITRATRYVSNLAPEDADLAGAYAITAEYRGDERWAVLRHGCCLGTDGRWDRERGSSERGDGWLDAHRFDLATALRLAEEQAADIAPAKWRPGPAQPPAV